MHPGVSTLLNYWRAQLSGTVRNKRNRMSSRAFIFSGFWSFHSLASLLLAGCFILFWQDAFVLFRGHCTLCLSDLLSVSVAEINFVLFPRISLILLISYYPAVSSASYLRYPFVSFRNIAWLVVIFFTVLLSYNDRAPISCRVTCVLTCLLHSKTRHTKENKYDSLFVI